MDYSGEGVSVYAEAKGEYTRQLCQYLTPALQKYFLDLLTVAKERETDPKKHLVAFQTLLEGISEWNMDKVQRETQALAMSTQCDYLEELLTAVFIAHTKVLSAIRLTNRQKKLQITIPKLEHFLHRTMTECARLLWSNTFLFATTGAALERQKNMRQIEALITEGVLQGVRGMLPVKSILREYLATEESEEEDEAEEAEAEADDAEEAEAEAEAKPSSTKEDAPTKVEEEKPPANIPAVLKEEEKPIGPTGTTQKEEPAEEGPTGTSSIPTIILDSVSSVVENLFAAADTPKAVKAAAEPELVEMDDIPAEEEKILEEEPPLVADAVDLDTFGAAPLSAEDSAIEFEEL